MRPTRGMEIGRAWILEMASPTCFRWCGIVPGQDKPDEWLAEFFRWRTRLILAAASSLYLESVTHRRKEYLLPESSILDSHIDMRVISRPTPALAMLLKSSSTGPMQPRLR